MVERDNYTTDSCQQRIQEQNTLHSGGQNVMPWSDIRDIIKS